MGVGKVGHTVVSAEGFAVIVNAPVLTVSDKGVVFAAAGASLMLALSVSVPALFAFKAITNCPELSVIKFTELASLGLPALIALFAEDVTVNAFPAIPVPAEFFRKMVNSGTLLIFC